VSEPVVVDGWVLEQAGSGWIARNQSDEAVTCWLGNDALYVEDSTQYYPRGDYRVPFSVIAALKVYST
jgi:hypothetical protein